jgi:hypothetical protein
MSLRLTSLENTIDSLALKQGFLDTFLVLQYFDSSTAISLKPPLPETVSTWIASLSMAATGKT